jgi:hypothetical protein
MNKLVVVLLVVVFAVGLTDRYGNGMDGMPSIDPRLAPFLAEWKRDIRSVGLDPDALLSGIRSIRVDQCERGKLGHANAHRILIDPKVLSRGAASTRGALYHELGHAVFDLDHGGRGIMSGTAHREAAYAEHWPGWLRDYLDRCTDGRDT